MGSCYGKVYKLVSKLSTTSLIASGQENIAMCLEKIPRSWSRFVSREIIPQPRQSISPQLLERFWASTAGLLTRT